MKLISISGTVKASFITVSMLALAVIAGCSSSSDSSTSGSTVQMQSQFTSNRVSPNSIGESKDVIQGGGGLTVDSLEVTSARIFIKDIKLHSELEDSLTDDHDEELKLGPFVAVFDSSGTHLLTTTVIPAGTYDRIKFEIHKFDKNSDDETDLDKDDSASAFKGNDPYTIILTGFTWTGGVRTGFTYYSKVTVNITWRFPATITLTNGSTATLIMKLDPVFLFKVFTAVLDPNDPKNRPAIDNAIKAMLKVENKL